MAKKPQAKPELATVKSAVKAEAAPAAAQPFVGAFEQGRAAFENMFGSTKAQFENLTAQFGSFRDVPPRAVEAFATGATAAVKGAELIGMEALAFSKARAEGSIAMARKLAEIRSVPAAFELQTSYARAETQAYVDYARKLGELTQALVKDSLAPVTAEVRAVTGSMTQRKAA